MSQEQKDGVNLILKTALVVLFSICCYFLHGMAQTAESTNVSVIQLEVWAMGIEKRLDKIEDRFQSPSSGK